MSLISFQLVTPERKVLSEELVSLTCPTSQGQITILPGHIPLVANLVSGELHAKTASGDFYLHISGGFIEVKEGSKVVVLADAAEHHFEIDATRAEEAKLRAQAALKNAAVGAEEYAKVTAALERSLTRLNIARKHAHRKNPLADQGTFNQ